MASDLSPAVVRDETYFESRNDAIRRRRRAGERLASLAAEYGISRARVGQIARSRPRKPRPPKIERARRRTVAAPNVVPDYDALDPGIRDAVRVVNDAGIETWQSCAGGDGHAFPEPTICIVGGEATVKRAARALQDGGYYPLQILNVRTAPQFEDENDWRITLRGPSFETFPWWSVQARAEQEEWVRRRYVNQIDNGEVTSA